MCDEADMATEYLLAHIEAATSQIRAEVAKSTSGNGAGTRNCVFCDKPIPEKRLQVLSGASRCRPCQEAYEESRQTNNECMSRALVDPDVIFNA